MSNLFQASAGTTAGQSDPAAILRDRLVERWCRYAGIRDLRVTVDPRCQTVEFDGLAAWGPGPAEYDTVLKLRWWSFENGGGMWSEVYGRKAHTPLAWDDYELLKQLLVV